jgi:uncharacterized protein YerC
MQTSNKRLPQKTAQSLKVQLATLLADLDSPTAVEAFLDDFLSETELSVLTKRLGILWLLDQGLSYQEIAEELKVSSATIASIAQVKEKKGVQLVVSVINRNISIIKRVQKWWPKR